MSTKQEFSRAAKNWLKAGRRTSYIVNLQSGFQEQFGKDAYVHDTLADTAEDSTAAPTDTTQGSDNDSNWTGTVPGGSNDDSPIYGAISIIQEHIASLGDNNLLDKWASTADALKRTVTSGMAQASPNSEGSTRDPLHVADNTNSQTPGSHGYIDVADLENAARKLTTLSARIVNVDKL